MKTREQVKEEFEKAGDTLSRWAADNGYPAALVYRVLSSETIPKRGKSHEIAVKLGLKDGTISKIESEPH